MASKFNKKTYLGCFEENICGLRKMAGINIGEGYKNVLIIHHNSQNKEHLD